MKLDTIQSSIKKKKGRVAQIDFGDLVCDIRGI